MARYYTLEDGRVAEATDYEAWKEWFENHYEQVCDVATTSTAHALVSTRFLAVSLTLAEREPPRLFETRVTGGWLDGHIEHHATRDEAHRGHETCVARVRAAEQENELPPPGGGW